MVITRKIEIYVHESDPDMKRNYMQTIYGWRDAIRRAANLVVSHKFVQQNVRDFMYLQEDVLDRLLQQEPDRLVKSKRTGREVVRYNVSDTLRKEKGMSEQNTTYRLLSSILKGKVPSDMYTCLNQEICKIMRETLSDINRGEATLRSYRNNIPMPFSARSLSRLHGVAECVVSKDTGIARNVTRYYFTLFGIPFACRLGRDRSNNAVILDRCISKEYKLCSSSISFEKTVSRETGKKQQKLFLHLCFDQPASRNEVDEKKVLYAYLGFDHPILCSYDVQARNGYDSGIKWTEIGTAEDFLYRRVQIQQALKRCQASCKYARGGRGRRRKMQAVERYAQKERNYVDTKVHTYASELVKTAVRYGCGTICLVSQTEREEAAKHDNVKGDSFVLRNWSYFNLKNKIQYKAGLAGVRMTVQGTEDEEAEETPAEGDER